MVTTQAKSGINNIAGLVPVLPAPTSESGS